MTDVIAIAAADLAKFKEENADWTSVEWKANTVTTLNTQLLQARQAGNYLLCCSHRVEILW